jgi:4'-phosphopantetheinyl transferase
MCVKLYQRTLPQTRAVHEVALLSLEEQAFAEKLRFPQVKQHYQWVRIAVRQILADYLLEPAEKIRFAKTEYGKPYLVDYPDINFNISHSGAFLLVAISEVGAIGVDVEQVQPIKTPLAKLVAHCFAEEEMAYWQMLPEKTQLVEFYRFWTRKEAFVKAVGRGIGLGLAQCVMIAEPPYLQRIPPLYGQPSDWRLFDLPLPDNLQGAVVIENRQLPRLFSLLDIITY